MVMRIVLMCVGVLCMMTTFLFLKHEKLVERNAEYDLSNIKTIRNIIVDEEDLLLKEVKSLQQIIVNEAEHEAEVINSVLLSDGKQKYAGESSSLNLDRKTVSQPLQASNGKSVVSNVPPAKPVDEPEQIGLLKCGGKYIDSEVIYWKRVPGDDTYESPITPHHGIHHDRYLTFEYDEGGWNNIRMGLVTLLILIYMQSIMLGFSTFVCAYTDRLTNCVPLSDVHAEWSASWLLHTQWGEHLSCLQGIIYTYWTRLRKTIKRGKLWVLRIFSMSLC